MKSCELVRLTLIQGGNMYWFASSQGASPGLMYQPSMNGRLVPHITANGKAWLASMLDKDAVHLALQGGLGQAASNATRFGPRALLSIDELLRELAATRERGYGLAVEEAEPGVKAIAVVVRAFDDKRVVSTMSIAGPLMRMGPERDSEFSALLHHATNTLSMVWPHDEIPIVGEQ